MLSQLKSFLNRFSRKSSEPVAPPETSIPAPNIPRQTAPARPATTAAQPPAAKPRPATVAAPSATATSTAINVRPDEVINLPTKVIVSRLPAALSALVKAPGDGNIALPALKVLEQLPRGSVKLSFAELRQAAPPGTFLDVTSQDETLVELPLPEILSRVNPEHLKRKPAQRQVEVPADVGNVFGPRGEQLPQPTGDTGMMRKPAAPAPARPVMPAKSAPAPAGAPAPKIATTIPVPVAKAPTPAPIRVPAPSLPKAAPAPTAAPQPASQEASPSATDKTQFFLKKEAVPAGEVLTVSLASISENWPQNIKQEIAAQKLGDSSVALPMAKVESALKTGKIIFGWQEVGNWLRPTPFSSTANADAVLELPLKVIAPLFISQHRPISPQKKVNLGENIPDIFAGGKLKAPGPVMEPPAPQPAAQAPIAPAPAAAAPAPAPTAIPAPSLPKPPSAPSSPALPKAPTPMPPLPKAAPTAPALPKLPTPAAPKPAGPIPVPLPKMTPAVAPAAAPSAEKEPQSLGELFGDPGKTEWSPKDVVQATNKLKGIAGAMVSLSDGLMVAGELPAPFRAETTAAFLPQIFGRMSQYAKELHLGDMNVISFECQKAPLIIYKSGMVFFGVLGRAGEPLPLSQIRFIAAELAKQNK